MSKKPEEIMKTMHPVVSSMLHTPHNSQDEDFETDWSIGL